ncbi:unnamed protein product [Clonostachys rosea]|uniref:Uncharacterized protein n=1 Tax=Bionectria ochroleuca TaxID=29856 RepID=A0ABY6UJE9_BIOOC|nr:unnamed protein product [Clonostachys rosea]
MLSNSKTVDIMATESQEKQLIENEIAKIEASELDQPSKDLILQVLQDGRKLSVDEVRRIWKLLSDEQKDKFGLTSRILWLEEGNHRAGRNHILKHKEEFANKGIPEEKLDELAEAATQVGYPAGYQGKGLGRPIVLLYFYNDPVAVAISVGANGFVVGMNPKNFGQMITKLGISPDVVREVSSWPRVS